MKHTRFLIFGCALLAALPAAAQTVAWDNTGNSLLNGAFNFREVIWLTDAQGSNRLQQAIAQYGTITFDGQGGYRIQASVWDSLTNTIQNVDQSGTYTLAASGFGFITRAERSGGIVYGGFSNDVFIGSSTDSQINNLFVAARANPNFPTTASFTGRYSAVYMNFPNLNMDQARDARYTLAPDGAGGLGAVSLTGYIGPNRTAVNQSINNATYTIAGSVGTLNFGGSLTAQNLLAGSHRFYSSPDGELIFGGGTNSWDMFIAVREASGVPSTALDPLFYSAGVDLDRVPSVPVLDTYFGAFKGGGGTLVAHQRLLVAPDTAAYDYTFSDFYTLSSDGRYSDFLDFQYFLSNNRRFQVGFGTGALIGVNVAVAAPPLSGSGVYLNPQGVLNGASFTPFTSGLAPGTLVTMFGTGFANANDVFVDATFPTTLGGVQVLVNNRLAPIYVVTANQISIVLPYDIAPPVADIRVVRAGTQSNRVTFFVNRTSPGIFTVPPRGIGYAAALHPDFSLIEPQNPASRREIIQLFLTGLGEVNPPVPAGTPGPTNPLSRVTAPVGAVIDGLDARVVYAGLAPQLPGLYQMNIEVPIDTRAQDVYLDVAGPDSYNTQVLLPVGNREVSDGQRAASGAGERARRQTRRPPDAARRGTRAPLYLDFER
jgi:uncharacterized protein (TIGR03437 family)